MIPHADVYVLCSYTTMGFAIEKYAMQIMKSGKRLILEADTVKHVKMKEKKSHQRDKYLGCPSRKILGTILKVDQRRTSTNGPGNKKTHDDA